MRRFRRHLLAIALFVASASSAGAMGLSMEATTPTSGLSPGDVVSYDIYIDNTDAQVSQFYASVIYDPSAITYEPGLSDAADYALYTGGKGASYVIPVDDPWSIWPDPPIGKEQVMIAFQETSLGVAAKEATREFLGHISFTVSDSTTIDFGFDGEGTNYITWQSGVGAVDISDTFPASITNGGIVTVIPEPTTAVLMGLGLFAFASMGRRAG